MKKKKIGLLILIAAAIAAAYLFFFRKPSGNELANANGENPQDTGEESMFSVDMAGEQAVDDVVETSSGVIYTGKVIPVESRYYVKNPELEFNQVYVEKGQMISEGTVLFDYRPDYAIDAKIDVETKKFNELKNKLDDYYSRIEEFKQWIAGTTDPGYIAYLNSEITNCQKEISQVKVDWVAAEENIRKLNESRGKTQVKSEIAGLVYNVNKDNSSTPTATAQAFVTIYSVQRKVRISVSEFEYQNLKVGENASIKIEGQNNRVIDCPITFIDSLPNNMESSETSYYNVDILVPDDIPYGYTAVVTVAKK